jgi:hypothetical protein
MCVVSLFVDSSSVFSDTEFVLVSDALYQFEYMNTFFSQKSMIN